MILGVVLGALGGAALGVAGLTKVKEHLLKKKVRQILREAIVELQQIERDMDSDDVSTTLSKLGNLATKLAYLNK